MSLHIFIIDYTLGIIMWTLIGRSAMNIFQREDSQFFFMRVFVKYTNPIIRLSDIASMRVMQAAIQCDNYAFNR